MSPHNVAILFLVIYFRCVRPKRKSSQEYSKNKQHIILSPFFLTYYGKIISVCFPNGVSSLNGADIVAIQLSL